MVTTPRPPAYRRPEFMDGREARGLRILAEYLEPLQRFRQHEVDATIVFMGSARTPEPERAAEALAEARAGNGDLARAEEAVAMAEYYAAARALARRLTHWSQDLADGRHYVVCTGGGPGIMEAANRGADDAGGHSIGLEISIPVAEFENPYLTPDLAFRFHYFFMRKFWFSSHGQGDYRVSRRLRHAGRAVRTVDPDPDRQDPKTAADRAVRNALLAGGGGFRRPGAPRDHFGGDENLVFRTDSIDEAFAFVTGELDGAEPDDPRTNP